MEFLVFFLAALLGHILANLRFTAMLPHRRDVIAIRPKFAAPQLFLHRGDPSKNFSGRNTFDRPHNFCRAIQRDRLDQKMHMLSIRPNFNEHDFITLSNLQTDLPQYLIDFLGHHHTSILRGAHDVIQQDRDVMFFVKELAHADILPASASPHPFLSFPSRGRGNMPAFIPAASGGVFSGRIR